MLITVCDVPADLIPQLEEIGGDICREYGGLCDVQFTEHKMYVREKYIKLRNREHKGFVLCDNEFSRVYIE